MSDKSTGSPTIDDLQIYLIQLQGVLRQRQEAAAAAELTKMELLSLEARAQRDAEAERAKLKAVADATVAQEYCRVQLEKARIEAASERAQHDAKVEAARIYAETDKKRRIEAIQQKSRTQLEIDEKTKKDEVRIARSSLMKYIDLYNSDLSMFSSLQSEVISLASHNISDDEILAGYRVVSANLHVISGFSELINVLEAAGVPRLEAIRLIQPTGFSSGVDELSRYTTKVACVPALGLSEWQPINRDGSIIDPWGPFDPPIAWRSRKTNKNWTVIPGSYHVKSFDSNVGADGAISLLNTDGFGGISTWRLPQIDELRALRGGDSLSLIGVDRIKRVWASYASAPGRATAFNFSDGTRETTGHADVCSLVATGTL